MGQNFDVVIIGSGPGGYVSAIRCAQLGLSVAVVERDDLGGVCLNWGCIPTKALLRSAELYDLCRHSDAFGFSAKDVTFSLSDMVKRSRAIAGQLSGGISHLLKKNTVSVIKGTGILGGKKNGLFTVKIHNKDPKTTEITGKNVVLAVGARPRVFPHLPINGASVVTSKEAMIPDTVPKDLLIIGSGAIGCEFAGFYGFLGSNVTIIEMQDRILPQEDSEVSAFAQKSFEQRGMTIQTAAMVEKIDILSNGLVNATIKSAHGTHQKTVDRVIVAAGITPNTDGVGIETTAAKTDGGHVVVDGFCQTAEPGLYAIGDCVAGPWLAHKASHEGVLVAEHITGVPGLHPINRAHIPACTYTTPEIASIGLTEIAARADGRAIKVGRFPFMANGKALTMGEKNGFIKTIFDSKTGELLGAHMIGAHVTELIQGYAIAMAGECTDEVLSHTIFPHPTLSEMMHEGVLDADNRSIHI